MVRPNWGARVDMWAAMGVDGIFVDRFSYDWGITREMQNGMLDAIHSRGLPAFVNGWFIDQVFSSQPDIVFPHGNPLGLPSHMQATDLYLLESFTVSQGGYAVCEYAIMTTPIPGSKRPIRHLSIIRLSDLRCGP